MDLGTVSAVVEARSRADLAALGPGVAVLAGGSVLFAEPHDHLTTLLDLTTLGWPAVTVDEDGLSLAATCPLVEVAALSSAYAGVWAAAPLFRQACTALYGSFKVWNVATIGGNLCTCLPAGPMTSLAAAPPAGLRSRTWELVHRLRCTSRLTVAVITVAVIGHSDGSASGDRSTRT